MPKMPRDLLDYLCSVSGAWRDDPRDDAELLAHFVDGDQIAYKTLVWRHGPLVWRTGKRVLKNDQDAEDIFQITFIALARKASRLRRQPLAGWLHRVARQAALDAVIKNQRRQNREHSPLVTMRAEEKDGGQTELQIALDEELANLPEKLRVPLVLRYLEEKTQDEVARVVGCSRSVVQRRLTRGESLLRERLERRGLALEAGTVAALLGITSGTSAMPVSLIENTTRAAVEFRAGNLTGGAAEGAQKLLHALATEGVMRKFWWVMLACVGALGFGGAGLVAWKMFGDVSKEAVPTTPRPVPHETATPRMAVGSHGNRLDCYGDPLPDGALARIGTVRFRPGDSPRGEFDGKAVFLPHGNTVVSVHKGNTVHFWETATGKELRRLEGPDGCQSIAVSHDGKKLAVGGKKELKVWDLEVDPPRVCFLKAYQCVGQSAIVFAPDNRTLAVSIEGQSDIWLLDTTNGELRKCLPGLKPQLGGGILSFSPDGKVLVAGDRLWDVATGEKQRDLNLEKKRTLKSLMFSLDGKMLATVETGWDREIAYDILNIRDAVTGAKKCQLADDVQGSFVAFLPDGKTLLEVRSDSSIRYWDLAIGRVKASTMVLSGASRCWSGGDKFLSLDGKWLGEADSRAINIWDVATGKMIGPTDAMCQFISALAFAPDDKQLATLEGWFTLRLWETDTGCSSDRRRIKATSIKLPPMKLKCSYAASPGGRRQLWGSNDCLTLEDRSGKKEIRRFPRPAVSGIGDLRCVDISADERSVLACYWAENENLPDASWIQIWSAATGKPLMGLEASLPCADGAIWCWPTVALSSDGRQVAAVMSNEPMIRLWEVVSGTERRRFKTSEVVRSIAWSPDGCLLAGGDDEGSLWLWDVATGEIVRHFTGHRGEVLKLAFSQNGLRVASAGGIDTTVLVWDLSGLSHPKPRAVELSSADALWTALREKEAARAWHAMHLLTQNPEVALPLLRERLRPVSPPDPKRVKRVTELLAQLDDDDFLVRNRAKEQLAKMSEGIESILQEALAKKPSLEVQKSIEKLLDEVVGSVNLSGLRPRQLQVYRGVEVLERIGTPAAQEVLKEVSRLPAWLVQAEEAKNALHRLKTMPAHEP